MRRAACSWKSSDEASTEDFSSSSKWRWVKGSRKFFIEDWWPRNLRPGGGNARRLVAVGDSPVEQLRLTSVAASVAPPFFGAAIRAKGEQSTISTVSTETFERRLTV